MKKLLILAACLSLTGCYSLKFNSQQVDDDAVYFTPVSGSHEEHFQESENVGFMLGGLIPMGSPNPANAISRYIGSGRKIANFKITAQQSFTDGFLSLLTFGIYTPLTITYEGDVVKPRPLAKKTSPTSTAAANSNTNNNNNNIVINNGSSSASQGAAGIPVIVSLNANPNTVRAGRKTALTANAMSPGGKSLRYNWSATGGTLSSNSGNVTFWSAPEQPGNYTVVISVTDDAGAQAAGAAIITVEN